MGFESMSVSDLRNALISIYGKTEEEANSIKGKANLVYELKLRGYSSSDEIMAEQKILEEEERVIDSEIGYVHIVDDSFNPDTTSNVEAPFVNNLEAKVKEEKVPAQTDPEWTDYVLTKFADNELFSVQGSETRYPNCSGLRRVCKLLLGEIVFSGPVTSQSASPTMDFPLGSSTVLYEIRVRNYYTDDVITYRSIANANVNNVDGDYALYPDSIAETRAEGRCLRKLLGLSSKVVSIEEMTNKKAEDAVPVVKTVEWAGEDRATDNQKALIITKCNQFKLDVMKFINLGKTQYGSLDEVKRETAAKMIQELTKYQIHENHEESKGIPETIKIEGLKI